MQLTKHTECRVCKLPLSPVIDLGMQHLQGAFLKPGRPNPPEEKVPMSLALCHGCSLLQSEYTSSPEMLYSHYWYRSGTNRTMREHLASIAAEAIHIRNKNDAMVLDIGCNDGTLLSFYPEGFKKFGVDPSDIESQGCIRIKSLFPSKELEGLQFDIITSIAMFYDLEDPVEFARAVKDILSPEGIWVIEVAYLPSMLHCNSYDTICAEHLEYYSLTALRSVLMWANLWPFRATWNPTNGGSVRVYVTHADTFNRKIYKGTLYDLFDEEFALYLWTLNPYLDFQKRIEKHRIHLLEFLLRLKEQGKSIHVYGASTKGNTILQWTGIGHDIIDFAADRNPEKWGAETLGTHIPIISEQESRALKPDYYLVLPWHFKEEFIERERQMLLNGTTMIFPLPEITLVDKLSL